MKRRTKKTQERAVKKQAKARSMENPSGESKYGRKRAFCFRNGVWGFEVPDPKPWK